MKPLRPAPSSSSWGLGGLGGSGSNSNLSGTGVTSVSSGDESGLTFLAVVAMHDPPRRECAAALQVCRDVSLGMGLRWVGLGWAGCRLMGGCLGAEGAWGFASSTLKARVQMKAIPPSSFTSS